MLRPTVRSLGLPLLAGAVALAAAGCSSEASPAWTFSPGLAAAPAGQADTAPAANAANAAPMSATAQHATLAMQQPVTQPVAAGSSVPFALNLTIVTGNMIGHTEFPAYVPSDFTLPANSTVVVTITNFDDATALPKGSEQYAKVSGTVDGTASVTPIKAAYPNGTAGTASTITSLNPNDVSHTFTIPGLGINVPIAAHARETFTIHTGAPGTFAWRCMDPCGADPMGWGTAMAARRGFMEGTLTVA